MMDKQSVKLSILSKLGSIKQLHLLLSLLLILIIAGALLFYKTGKSPISETKISHLSEIATNTESANFVTGQENTALGEKNSVGDAKGSENSQNRSVAANTPISSSSDESGSQPPASPAETPPDTPEQNTDPDPEEPPVPESPSAIVAYYSDSQSDTDGEDQNHQRVVNYILATAANPVFHAGDLMEDGTQASLDRFNAVTVALRSNKAFYSALGNNDRVFGDVSTPSPLYFANFIYPNNERWYSVNVGNLHMVILDSAFPAGADQLNWLQSDLQSAASQNRITGVMYHHPTFASTISSYLINNGVDFVVAGHIHTYQHTISEGINYFTATGQPTIGYFLANIYSSYIDFKVYNSTNSLVETIRIDNR